jgi:hypothetical protein
MGWWGTTKRVAQRGWQGAKRHSGKIARESLNIAAATAAGTACAVPPLTPLAPACAMAAAVATDRIVGGKVERVTRRTFDKTSAMTDDFVDYLKGGAKAARPPGMPTEIKGIAATTRLEGDASAKDPAPFLIAAGASGLAVIAITIAVLKRTGRI